MERAVIRTHVPSLPVAYLAGTLGAVLALSLGRAAPLFGLPLAQPDLAVGGAWAYLLLHAVIFVIPLTQTWDLVQEGRDKLIGAAVRGLAWGALLAAAFAIIVTIATGFDLGRIVVVAVGEVAYGLALALIPTVARGLSVAEAIGWGWWSHASGEIP